MELDLTPNETRINGVLLGGFEILAGDDSLQPGGVRQYHVGKIISEVQAGASWTDQRGGMF